VYTSAVHAGTATATLATWSVDDLEEVVDNLGANGVTSSATRTPRRRLTRGVYMSSADSRVAWFKDPDGNTFALEERSR
jgi:hypothetical protein